MVVKLTCLNGNESNVVVSEDNADNVLSMIAADLPVETEADYGVAA